MPKAKDPVTKITWPFSDIWNLNRHVIQTKENTQLEETFALRRKHAGSTTAREFSAREAGELRWSVRDSQVQCFAPLLLSLVMPLALSPPRPPFARNLLLRLRRGQRREAANATVRVGIIAGATSIPVVRLAAPAERWVGFLNSRLGNPGCTHTLTGTVSGHCRLWNNEQEP
jgi:hypothetical protein